MSKDNIYKRPGKPNDRIIIRENPIDLEFNRSQDECFIFTYDDDKNPVYKLLWMSNNTPFSPCLSIVAMGNAWTFTKSRMSNIITASRENNVPVLHQALQLTFQSKHDSVKALKGDITKQIGTENPTRDQLLSFHLDRQRDISKKNTTEFIRRWNVFSSYFKIVPTYKDYETIKMYTQIRSL